MTVAEWQTELLDTSYMETKTIDLIKYKGWVKVLIVNQILSTIGNIKKAVWEIYMYMQILYWGFKCKAVL